MNITSVFFDDCFKNHVPMLNNPECSARVENIIDLIHREGFKNISFHQPEKIVTEHLQAANAMYFFAEKLLRFQNND
jgi:hypothetical protein